MFFKEQMQKAHQSGYKQGMYTALLVASPFILAGVKWLAENRRPVMERVKDLNGMELYSRVFNKQSYQEKEAEEKLEKFRSSDGNYSDYDVEAGKEEDEALFHMIKEIAKNEISKTNDQLSEPKS